MNSGKLPVQSVLISLVIISGFGLLVLVGLINFSHFPAAFSGFLLSLLNFFVGYLVLRKMKDKPFNRLFAWLVAGILLRLFLMLFLVIIMLYFLELNRFSFIFSFLFFYIFFLISEVFYLNTRQI